MRKIVKLVAGIAALPACWAVSRAVYRLFQDSVEASADGWHAWALPAGFAAWVAVFFLLPRPARLYVLGHELTHALWALMMGGRVGKLKVGKSGGHVVLSKTNFLITLAPYFFPFYTFLAIASYYAAGLLLEVEPYRAWWLAAVGATWSFHLTFTLHTLSQRQPDVQEHGRIFSYSVIYLMNLLAMGLWLVAVGTPTLAGFGRLLGDEAAHAYAAAQAAINEAWIAIARFAGQRT